VIEISAEEISGVMPSRHASRMNRTLMNFTIYREYLCLIIVVWQANFDTA